MLCPSCFTLLTSTYTINSGPLKTILYKYLVKKFLVWCGICRFSRISVLLVCMAPLTLAMITMKGLTFHPYAFIVFINGLYLSSFICMVWSSYLSCVKVHSMIWMVCFTVGISIPFCSYAAPCMYTISSLSFVRHSHHLMFPMHPSIHVEIVFVLVVAMLAISINECEVSSVHVWF